MRRFHRSAALDRCLSLRLGAFLLGIIPLCNAQTKLPTTPSTIYERTHLSVVVIVTADKDAKPIGQGSGFIIARDKVVTNHHVIEGAAAVVVVFADGSTSEVEGIVADSPARDLTILSVNTGTRSALRFGDELSVRQGDSVYAVGAPRGLELSITNGIVSGFRHIDEEFMIQNTAPIAPGSSGGPLFDRDGRVIGVTTSLLTDSPGIYFSIGAGDVRRLLRTPNIVVAPLPKRIENEESASTSRPASSLSVKAESPTKRSLIVNSNPPSAAVFVNGIKQPGQTPMTLSLSAGQYNIALRLPGYIPYVGSVEVREDATQIDAELRKELHEDISGTYRGTVHNSTAGMSAKFNIFIKQQAMMLSGCINVQRPLYGSGYLNGTVEGNAVSFLTTAPMFQISFHGKRTGDKITGNYTVLSQPVQVGEFDLEKSSSEAPSASFDTNKCPSDYTH
jgi:S1-C subfamily serine protease